MTQSEVIALMQNLEKVFAIVRLVDLTHSTQMQLTDGVLVTSPLNCFVTWKKSQRCENCISVKATMCKGTRSKFEFSGDDLYYANAMYIEVDGQPRTIEMVSVVNDETLLGAYGKEQLIESIANYNKNTYMDTLTGAYSRKYYEEQLHSLPGEAGLAVIGIDDLTAIKESRGENISDKALKAVARMIRENIRESDALVRYSDDEFLIVFPGVPHHLFPVKLEKIRKAADDIGIPESPDLNISISIGAVYCSGETSIGIEQAENLLRKSKENQQVIVKA